MGGERKVRVMRPGCSVNEASFLQRAIAFSACDLQSGFAAAESLTFVMFIPRNVHHPLLSSP
jgi:hypothetical protein